MSNRYGTAGAGLVELNRSTGKFKRFTVEDGLMMNRISCLELNENTPWIGYGERRRFIGVATDDAPEGGLGRLDLSSRKFSSFLPSITNRKQPLSEQVGQPTLLAVQALASAGNADIWLATFTANQAVRHYIPALNKWEGGQSFGNCTSLVAEKGKLFAGWYWNFAGDTRGPLGVSVLDVRGSQWASFPEFQELPAGEISALQPHGDQLWAGGAGYIARLDLRENRLLNYAYIPSTVERLQVGGAYLWAQYNCSLHRVNLLR